MKKLVFLLLIIPLLYSCAPSKKIDTQTQIVSESSTIKDGSSFEKAILINESSENAGIRAEYEWLRKNYPGYKLQLQSLSNYKKVPYDILEIITSTGEKKSIYFNISKFFGKF